MAFRALPEMEPENLIQADDPPVLPASTTLSGSSSSMAVTILEKSSRQAKRMMDSSRVMPSWFAMDCRSLTSAGLLMLACCRISAATSSGVNVAMLWWLATVAPSRPGAAAIATIATTTAITPRMPPP